METYCVSCKKNCAVCSKKKTMFIKNQEASSIPRFNNILG